MTPPPETTYRDMSSPAPDLDTLRAQFEEVAAQLLDLVRPGDMIVTLGAGDVWTVAQLLHKRP